MTQLDDKRWLPGIDQSIELIQKRQRELDKEMRVNGDRIFKLLQWRMKIKEKK